MRQLFGAYEPDQRPGPAPTRATRAKTFPQSPNGPVAQPAVAGTPPRVPPIAPQQRRNAGCTGRLPQNATSPPRVTKLARQHGSGREPHRVDPLHAGSL